MEVEGVGESHKVLCRRGYQGNAFLLQSGKMKYCVFEEVIIMHGMEKMGIKCCKSRLERPTI